MANRNDEYAALADIYAESLLAVAEDRNQSEAVAEALTDLVAYMDADKAFDTFLTSAAVDESSRQASLEKLFRGKMSDLLLDFLQVLNRRDRCDLIRPIERCVVTRMRDVRNQQEVRVETAMPLTDDLRAGIVEEISRRFGKEAVLIEEVRPDLIGGTVIHIGDVRIDSSVASQIKNMRGRLIARARDEVRSGRGYVVET